MSDGGAKPRLRRIWKYLLAAGMVGALIVGALAWYATTDSFQAMVRNKVVKGLEGMSGGRVELGSVHTVPFHFQIEIRDLTIHGRESNTDVPYVHIDRSVLRLKLAVSSFGLGFQSIVFEHPVIHVIVYPDGTTNQPTSRLAQPAGEMPIKKLFSFSVNQLEVRRGELIWNDEKIPLEFTANDVSADMTYFLLRNRYEASILLGKVVTSFKDFRPVAWTAAMQLRLTENGIDVRSLKISTGHTHVEARGSLINFAKPKITGAYDLVVDLAEAGTISHRPEIRGGTVEAVGAGHWTGEDFSSVGTLHVRDMDWRNPALSFRGSSFDTGFSIDPQRVRLPDIVGKLFGGTITGSTEITEWQSVTLPNRTPKMKIRKTAEQSGIVRLKLKDLSGSEMAVALSTPRRPFNRMNIAGEVAGTIDAQWKGSPNNTIAEVTLDVIAPAAAKPHQVGLNGHTHAIYRQASGELEISEFTAATKATQIRGAGTLSTSAAVKLSVVTTNLGEWQPILVALGYDQPAPIALRGPASFTGTATGRLSSITFAGRLQSGDFDFIIPATSRTREEDMHWESFTTDIRISPAGLALRNGTLRRDGTTIGFDINLGLQDRRFTPSSPFTAKVSVVHADLAEVLGMTHYDYPASGILDLSIQLAGTRNDPVGHGRVQIVNAIIHGQPIQRFNSTVSFGNGEVVLHNIELAQSQARVTGDGTYTLATHAFTFDLGGTHFNLADVSSLQFSRVAVEGGLDFVAHGSGTVENPAINATIRLRDSTLDHELAGDFTLAAITQGGELKISGNSQFKSADLRVEGNIHPAGDWPATLNLRFNHLDVDSILRSYLHGHLTGHSAVTGDLHVEGPLRRPGELNLIGNLSDFSADIENVKLQNQGLVRFAVANRVLKVEQFHLLGANTDLSADGSVQLAGEHQLDFRARGQLNLQLIQSYNSDFISTGAVTVDVTIAGTTANPLAHGRMQITNGSIAYADSPSALSGVNGTVTFNQNRFEIESLTGRVGGGLMTFRGNASLANRQINFDLGLHGEGVRLRYPTGVSSTANLDLQFTGNSRSSTLSGDVTVTKVAVTPGFDFGAYLQRTAQSSALSQTNPILNGIRLDVHIVTTPELQMQTAVIRLSGDADLRLRGTAAKSVLLGRADVLEGEAYFNGTKYRLERGDVTFSNPVTTDPVVDLQASTQVRDYEITLVLNGPVDKLNLTYRSEPPLPTSDIIALLAFGQTSQQSSQLQQAGAPSFNQEASNAILAAALNTTVSNRTHRIFGVNRIKIDPQGLNTETSPTQSGPAITIEQQVASNITLTYSTNVSQTSQQVIQGEYNVSRNISVVAIRDQDGVVSFEVRIRQRKK